MKCAALIIAHDRPDCLSELLSRLAGALWEPYVHVDAKSDMSQFAHLHARAHFLTERQSVYWGHISQVDATLALLRCAIKDETLTHFALMSGRCIPIRPDAEISAQLSAGGNFIDQRRMPNEFHKLQRISKPHFRQIRSATLRKLSYHLRKWRMPEETRKLQNTVRFASGSSWWVLSRDAVTAILKFLDKTPWYHPAFAYALCPDEFFFHTAFQYIGLQPDGPSQTYARFPIGASNPVTLDAKEWELACASGKLFARKTDAVFF